MLKRKWNQINGYGFDRKKVINGLEMFNTADELISTLQEEKLIEQQREQNRLAQHQQPARQQNMFTQPAQFRPAPQQNQQWGVLPQGWEAKRDPRNGRAYYINHRTRQTTYDQPLPPGWEAKSHNGRPYFINHNNQQTSWTDP